MPSFTINQLDTDEIDQIIRFSTFSKFSLLYRQIRLLTTFLVLITMLVLLKVFRRKQTASLLKFDDNSISPSDFTVIVLGLPPGEYTNKEISDIVMANLTKIYLKKDYSSMIKVEKIVISLDIRAKIKQLQKFNRMITYKKKFMLKKKFQNDQQIQKHGVQPIEASIENKAEGPLKIPNFDWDGGNNVDAAAVSPDSKKQTSQPNNDPLSYVDNKFINNDPKLLKAPDSLNYKQSGVVFVTLSKQEGLWL